MSTNSKWIILALIPVILLGTCFLILSEFGVLDSVTTSLNWTDYNDSINASNQLFADKNEFGFTDDNRSRKRKKDEIRIAVLGDSFVWGDGLPYHKVWPHQLQLILDLKQPNKNIEVLIWSQCGWSTLDQYNFILNHGHEFDVDILLIGFVHNDPDLGNIIQVENEERQFLSEVKSSIPLLGVPYVNRVLTKRYESWMRKLYSPENLNAYSELLSKLDSVTSGLNWTTRFIFTPSVSQSEEQYFTPIKKLLDKQEMQYFNLEPIIRGKYNRGDYEKLRANPANGHPGEELNTVFATNIYSYLKREKTLQN